MADPGSIDPSFELSLASLVVLCCFRFYFLFYENTYSCSFIPCMNSEAPENLYYSVDGPSALEHPVLRSIFVSPCTMSSCLMSPGRLKTDFLETSPWFTACFILFQVRLLLMMASQKHSVKLLNISKMTCLITTCLPLSIECGSGNGSVQMKFQQSLLMHSNHDIFVLLKLALTLPVTTCECERSFSQLKLIKTCRRSTMTDDRLIKWTSNHENKQSSM